MRGEQKIMFAVHGRLLKNKYTHIYLNWMWKW